MADSPTHLKALSPSGNVFVPMLNEGELAVMQCFEFLFLAVARAGAWNVDATRRRRQQAARTS